MDLNKKFLFNKLYNYVIFDMKVEWFDYNRIQNTIIYTNCLLALCSKCSEPFHIKYQTLFDIFINFFF